MDEGEFGEWLKQDGEQVNAGDMIFVLEGEKSSQEIESFDSGILRILPAGPQPGDNVQVGQLLGFLVEAGEELPLESVDVPQKTTNTDPPAEVAENPQVQSRPTNNRDSSGTVAISPRARRVARELGVDWSEVRGSGRYGRIREEDIRAAATAGRSTNASQSGTVVPITRLRRTIAERMLAGIHEAAPVTLTTKVDATHLVGLREQFKSVTGSKNVPPSYTDLIVKLTAMALEPHPLLRSQWREEGLVCPDAIDIAFAVDTAAGLLAPVLRNVDTQSLTQVAAESRTLIEQARAGKLAVDRLQGGVFTVSNLGSFGVDAFTPILNLPQSAILGVGRIVREPVVLNNEVVARDMMSLSLTFDHRVVDGAPAARFLDTLRGGIEKPGPWLIG